MDAIKYISQVLLKPGENLVVLFAEGNDAKVGKIGVPLARAFFFKVSVEVELVRRYQLFTLNRAAGYYPNGVLEAQSGVQYDFLGDLGHGLGNDILRIRDDDWWVYHFGYSPLQQDLRVYKRLAAEVGITGFEYATPELPDPTVGTPYGYIKGREVMNYYDPPVETETLMFRNSRAGELWQFGLWNESIDTETGQMDPCLLIRGKAYRLLPILKPDIMKRLLTGEIPRHMLTFDGIKDIREETYLPLEWKEAGGEMYVTWEEITGVTSPTPKATPATRGRP